MAGRESRGNIRRVQRDGRFLSGGSVSLHVLGRQSGEAGPGTTRVEIVVSRRSGGAVARNRLRRQLRAILRDAEVLPAGADVVVSCRKEASERSYQELALEIWKLLEIYRTPGH